MENQGWIKLYTKLRFHPIMQSGDPYLLQLFTYCLLKANWKDNQVIIGEQVVNLKAGQFITGRKSLVKDLTKTKRENSKMFVKYETLYRRKLFLLEKLDVLTIKPTNKYTIVTIKNWNKYQGGDQQVTNKRPSDDHQMTTEKIYKNKKIVNTKKEIYKERKFASLKEITEDVLTEIAGQYKVPLGFVKLQFEKMTAWIESTGKTRKDYKATLRGFVLRDMQRQIERPRQRGGVAERINPNQIESAESRVISDEERAKIRTRLKVIKESHTQPIVKTFDN